MNFGNEFRSMRIKHSVLRSPIFFVCHHSLHRYETKMERGCTGGNGARFDCILVEIWVQCIKPSQGCNNQATDRSRWNLLSR